jgi:hypothetical protein
MGWFTYPERLSLLAVQAKNNGDVVYCTEGDNTTNGESIKLL